MISAIDKKQMYDSVITGGKNASKEWNWNTLYCFCIVSISSMFLTSYVYFNLCLVIYVLCV